MKRLTTHLVLSLIIICMTTSSKVHSQQMDVNVIEKYRQAPAEIQKQKAFLREKWFYEQRAYPNDYIPTNARPQALMQKKNMNSSLHKSGNEPKLFSYSDWTNIGPAPGKYGGWGFISGRTPAIAIDPKNPSRIFIGGANGGIWRTTDKGSSWTPLTDHEASLATGSISIDPNNTDIIYVGTGEATYSGTSYYGAGLLKSVDGGNTWTNISNGIPMGAVTSRVLLSPMNLNLVLTSQGTRGIYRSVDAGNSWTRVFATRVDDMVFNPNDYNILFAVGGDGTGLIRSTNAGQTWQPYGTGLARQAGRMQMDICKAQPTVLYATTYNETGSNQKVRVYKSTDTAVNWIQVGSTVDFKSGQAWYDFHLRVSPYDPNICFIGTIEIFRTTDGGTTWTEVSKGYSGGAVHVDQHDFRFDSVDPNTVYAGNDGGLYRSNDLGNTWASLNAGLTMTQFYRIAADPADDKHIIGGTQDNGTQQTFGQTNWTDAFGGDGGEVCFSTKNSQIMIGESQNGGLSRSTNGGYLWTPARDGFLDKEPAAWVAPIIFDHRSTQTFYHGRVNFYKSTNGGKNWEKTADTLFNGTVIREMAISNHPTDPIIYCTKDGDNKVVRSFDDGQTFVAISGSLPNRTITSICTHPHPDSGMVAFITLSGFGGPKVYRTKYDNSGWMSISGNLPDTPVNDIFVHPDMPENFIAVATDIGVFVTENYGKSWAELSTGLPNTVVLHLDYHPTAKKLRAGTHGRSVWEMTITPVPVEPPRNLVASADFRSATITWDASITPNIKQYSVYRGTKTGLGDHIANVGTNLAFLNTGLENNKTYYYRVRAVTASDSSVLSAEVSATPKVWQGCIGSVLELDGGGHVLLPPTLNTFAAFTVEGWVWWKTFNTWSRFVDIGERDHSFVIANEAKTGNLVFQVYDQNKISNGITSQGVLTNDRPVHVAAVSGSNGMKLYLDGQLLDTHPYSGGTKQTGATKITNYMGRSNWTTDLNFIGQIDEVRIWKTERSEQQIKTDFNRTLTPNEIADTNLVAYWNFEDSDDTLVYDVTSKNNNAKLKGSALVVDCETPVSVDGENVRPLAFELKQNHPNPVASTTTISFTLDKASIVSLDVFNTLGQRIVKLINDELMEPGAYSHGFDGSRLPIGVYMYVLRTGNHTAVKKMTVMR